MVRTELKQSACPIAPSSSSLTGLAASRGEPLRQRGSARPLSNVADWAEWLAHVDREISRSRSCGLAAAVIVEVRIDGTITGASVGDCEAWLFVNGTMPKSLTAEQIRKPLLGEGAATPVGFEARVAGGTLIAATDGLWKYLNRTRIAEAASIRPLETAAEALVNGVRLRSGALQDDVAVAIVGWQ